MSDVNCPYCGADQEINNDDGYGLEENGDYYQECVACEKEFNFTTSIMLLHKVYCDESVQPHEWEDGTVLFQFCKNCEASRCKPDAPQESKQ